MRYRELFERTADHMIDEASIEQAVDRVVTAVSSGAENDADLQWEFSHSENHDLDDEPAEPDEEERERFIRRWAQDRVEGAVGEIEACFRGNTIRVWRMITAPENWKPEERHVGIYWSWSAKAAEAHWGEFHLDYIRWTLEAEVEAHQIDWPKTLYQNALTAYCDEKEIRLKKDTPVHLLKVSNDLTN